MLASRASKEFLYGDGKRAARRCSAQFGRANVHVHTLLLCIGAVMFFDKPLLPIAGESRSGFHRGCARRSGALDQLSALSRQGQGGSAAAIALRQDILEKIMHASFAFDSVLARIQVEISYTEETRILLENREKHRESRYALASFLAGGVSGTAGSAMSLTSSLNHAGTAVGLVGGGSVLALALVQSTRPGPKQVIQSPLNMLAQILGVAPNSKSGYPPVVLALISVPGPEGGMYVSRLPSLWRQLNRLQADEHDKKGSSLQSVTCDADGHMQTTAGELSDREAMLQDLNASLLALRSRLGGLLDQVQNH